MATVTYISARMPLRKTQLANGSWENYPRAKRVTSATRHYTPGEDGLEDLAKDLMAAAGRNEAIIASTPRKALVNESRAGQFDSAAFRELLILDVDGFAPDGVELNLPLTRDDLLKWAKAVIALLPEPFQHASYIFQASSKFGTATRAGGHFFFFLSPALPPKGLKHYLHSLNYSIPAIQANLRLNDSGMSVKKIVDPVMAEPSRICFIAPPVFRSAPDPFTAPDQRWLIVHKPNYALDLTGELAKVDIEELREAEEQTLKRLRRKAGLTQIKPRWRQIRSHEGELVRVNTNPGELRMTFAYDNERFVYYNVNGGDSNAYYVPISNPDIVYNFKGEPPFEFAKADPETYSAHLAKYRDKILKTTDLQPLVIRDMVTDKHYSLLANFGEDTVDSVYEIGKQNIEDWLAEWGRTVPDPIPTWRIVFDPHNTRTIDPEEKILNLYRPSQYLRNPAPVMRKGAPGKFAETLALTCPAIFKVIYHVCGNDNEAFEHYLNWLCVVVTKRIVTGTAWLFSGTQGTGKGVMYDMILKPIIGAEHCERKRIDHLEDKYNDYMHRALLICYDEFRLDNSPQASRIYAQLKDFIQQTEGTIRAMYSPQTKVPLYVNYMFFSNDLDPVYIEEGDRRFNVAPRQEVKLKVAHPELFEHGDLAEVITPELPAFAGYLLASEHDVSLARTALENTAKVKVRELSLNWSDRFCHALKHGELEYFMDYLPATGNITNPIQLANQAVIRNLISSWLADAINGEPTTIRLQDLQLIYETIGGQAITQPKFTRVLNANNLTIGRRRIGGERTRCIDVQFRAPDVSPNELARLAEQYRPESATTH